MKRAALVVSLIGIAHIVIPLPHFIRHERGLLMLILKLFEFMANLLKLLKRTQPPRLIFLFLRVAHNSLFACRLETFARNRGTRDRPGRSPETPAVPILPAAAPWWCRLRRRGLVSDKLCRLAELRPECHPHRAGSRSLPVGGGSLILAELLPIAPAR
jgi:hypothetical protein